jgi:hypothetical protein
MVYHSRRKIFNAIRSAYGLTYVDEDSDSPSMNEETLLDDLDIGKTDKAFAVMCVDYIAKELDIKDYNGLVKKLQNSELETLADVVDIIGDF